MEIPTGILQEVLPIIHPEDPPKTFSGSSTERCFGNSSRSFSVKFKEFLFFKSFSWNSSIIPKFSSGILRKILSVVPPNILPYVSREIREICEYENSSRSFSSNSRVFFKFYFPEIVIGFFFETSFRNFSHNSSRSSSTDSSRKFLWKFYRSLLQKFFQKLFWALHSILFYTTFPMRFYFARLFLHDFLKVTRFS